MKTRRQHGAWVESVSFEAGPPAWNPDYHFLAVQLWASYLTTLVSMSRRTVKS